MTTTRQQGAFARFIDLWAVYRTTGRPEDYAAAMQAKAAYNAVVHAGCWELAPGPSAMMGERVRRRP